MFIKIHGPFPAAGILPPSRGEESAPEGGRESAEAAAAAREGSSGGGGGWVQQQAPGAGVYASVSLEQAMSASV